MPHDIECAEVGMRVEHIPPRWKRELEPHQLNCYDGLPADVIEDGYVLDRSTRR